MPCRNSEENMEKRLQQVFENLNQEIETLEAHAKRIEALLLGKSNVKPDPIAGTLD